MEKQLVCVACNSLLYLCHFVITLSFYVHIKSVVFLVIVYYYYHYYYYYDYIYLFCCRFKKQEVHYMFDAYEKHIDSIQTYINISKYTYIYIYYLYIYIYI